MDAVPNQITSLDEAQACLTSVWSKYTSVLDENQQLRWRVRQLEKELYGSSAESTAATLTLSKEQILLSLFPASTEPPATQQVLLLKSEEQKEQRPRRQPAARVLETVTERLESTEKVCPHCGQAKCEIGCEKSERFEYMPAKIIRHEIVRPKLACPCGQGGVSIAPLPPSVVPGGLPGPGLVAHILLSKYDDHLPLYRQQQQLERLGVHFARQTMGDWIEKGADLLQPIVREMKRQLLTGDYVQADETPVRVMDPEVKGRCATGYLWVMGRPAGDVVFEFHPGRGKEYAKLLLGDFQGYLQRDGYGVYGALAVERPQIQGVGCWAHARRKYIEALEEWPGEAGLIVTEIRKLYLIEQHARTEGFTPEQRWGLRQSHSLPILAGLKPRLEELAPRCLPQSPLGKAVRYTLGEWTALQRYTIDGRLEIDNNLTENAIRPSAVGKKNWLFIGHPEAGWRSAVIYSVIASCRRRGIDPWQYVTEMLRRLPGAKITDVPELVPARWSAGRSP
jgi:transposase